MDTATTSDPSVYSQALEAIVDRPANHYNILMEHTRRDFPELETLAKDVFTNFTGPVLTCLAFNCLLAKASSKS